MLTRSKGFQETLLACSLAGAITAGAVTSAIGAEKVLYTFKGGKDGLFPFGVPITDNSGNLYGTTFEGGGNTGCNNGSSGCGTVYRLAPDRTETVLHAFTGGCDGAYPHAGLVADTDGNMYGTTQTGGICNNDGGFGTVFKLTRDGTESILYAFQGGDGGQGPAGGLVVDGAGNFYGTTFQGGDVTACDSAGCGIVFEITPQGAENVLYAFQGGSDGAEPFGGVIRDDAGNLFGTTETGGGTGCNTGCGTVFELAPNGSETILHAFQEGTDGEFPENGVVEDSAGNLYGTTFGGGTDLYGTVFKVTSKGVESVLYSFQPGSGGYYPQAGVILDTAGNLYGTTYGGGSTRCHGIGCGVVFKLTPGGKEKVLYSFNWTHGAHPATGLLMDSNGTLYGTAPNGGKYKHGVIFRLKK